MKSLVLFVLVLSSITILAVTLNIRNIAIISLILNCAVLLATVYNFHCCRAFEKNLEQHHEEIQLILDQTVRERLVLIQQLISRSEIIGQQLEQLTEKRASESTLRHEAIGQKLDEILDVQKKVNGTS